MDKWPGFVEGHLTGVVIRDQRKTVDVFLSDCKHEEFVLRASGVKELCVFEMRVQNIIDRLSVWDSSCLDRECEENLWLLIYGNQPDAANLKYAAEIRRTIQLMRDESMALLKIEPVYGALVLILAKNFECGKRPASN